MIKYDKVTFDVHQPNKKAKWYLIKDTALFHLTDT